MKKILFPLILLLLTSISVFGETTEIIDWRTNLERGDDFFKKGLDGDPGAFIMASREYRTALERGAPRDYRIFYNRANALYLSGFPGEAAAEYRRALFYKPGDEKSRQNLNRVLGETGAAPDEKDSIQTLLFTALYLTGYERALYSGLVLFSLSWLILIFAYFIRRKTLSRLFPVLLLLSIWDLSLCFAWHSSAARKGVITAGQVSMRIGDSYAYESLYSSGLPEGTAFDLLEERAGWIYIRLDDGTEGWIEKNSSRKLLIEDQGLDS